MFDGHVNDVPEQGGSFGDCKSQVAPATGHGWRHKGNKST